MAFPMVRFTNEDVTIYVTSVSENQIDLTCPVLPAGQYFVSVVTAEGQSNTVPFEIVEAFDPTDGFTQITDHVEAANNRLLHQYKRPLLDATEYADSKQVAKLVQGLYSQGVQGVEDAAFTIIPKTTIDENVGAALDGIGDIIGQIRNGLDDETYKVYLKGKLALNTSNGEMEDIYRVWNAFTLGNPSEIIETFPAGIDIWSDTTPNTDYIAIIKDYIDKALAAGVRLGQIIIYDPVEAFQFAPETVSVTDAVHGFSDTTNPTTGGKLATII